MRFYHAGIARFLQRDMLTRTRIGGRTYAYCANSPGLSVDPTGLVASSLWWKLFRIWTSRLITPVATWFRANEYWIKDEHNELQPQIYRSGLRNFYYAFACKLKAQGKLDGQWRAFRIPYQNAVPGTGQNVFTARKLGLSLGSSARVYASGSLEVRCVGNKVSMRNRRTVWEWKDDIDFKGFEEAYDVVKQGMSGIDIALQYIGKTGERVLDLAFDKVLDVDYRVIIQFTDDASAVVNFGTCPPRRAKLGYIKTGFGAPRPGGGPQSPPGFWIRPLGRPTRPAGGGLAE